MLLIKKENLLKDIIKKKKIDIINSINIIISNITINKI